MIDSLIWHLDGIPADRVVVNPDNLLRIWKQGRERWLDWVSTQTWRSDAVGEKAREIMAREDRHA